MVIGIANAELVQFLGRFRQIVAIFVKDVLKLRFVFVGELEIIIVFAVGGSDVNDAGTFFFADEVCGVDLVSFLIV